MDARRVPRRSLPRRRPSNSAESAAGADRPVPSPRRSDRRPRWPDSASRRLKSPSKTKAAPSARRVSAPGLQLQQQADAKWMRTRAAFSTTRAPIVRRLFQRVANSAQASGTRERIRQIEAKAPQKLKHPSLACALRTFLEQ